MNYKEESEKFFKKDLFATEATGIIIDEVKKGYARCHFDILPHHKNADGVVMGGAIFTLADFTFAVAANAGEAITVSQNCNITYHAPAIGKHLYAESESVKSGKSTCFFITKVFTDEKKLVATVTSTGFRKIQ